MPPLPFVLGLLIMAGLAGLAGRIALARYRQVRALGDLARTEHLTFSSEDVVGLHARYHNLDLIRQGPSRHACNLLYGPTEAGPVTLFSYSYDLGFGVHQTNRQWWFAVLETGVPHDHWRAFPEEKEAPEKKSMDLYVGAHWSTPGGRFGRLDRFRIDADHEDTHKRLTDAGIECLFRAVPGDYHWEVRGPLLAVAAPFDSDPQTPIRLLAAARELARILEAAKHLAPHAG